MSRSYLAGRRREGDKTAPVATLASKVTAAGSRE
jgi:hypothetical protein